MKKQVHYGLQLLLWYLDSVAAWLPPMSVAVVIPQKAAGLNNHPS